MNLRYLIANIAVLVAITGCDLFVSANTRMERAAAAIAVDDYDRANIELRNALKSEPSNVAVRIKLVEVLLLLSDLRTAEIEATPLKKITDSSPAVANNIGDILARLLLAKRDFAGLLAAAESGELRLSGPNLALREAQAMIGLEKIQPAIEKLRQALQQQPDNIEARVWYSQALSGVGDSRQASKELDTVFSQSSTYAKAWLAKGILQLKQGPSLGATQSLGKAVEYAGGQLTRLEEISTLGVLIENELAIGKIDDATAHQKRLAMLSPKSVVVDLLAAQIAFAKGEYSTAISSLQVALGKSPDLPPARILLARAQAAQGNFRQAEAELEKMLAKAGNSVAARTLLAEVELKLDQPVKAVEVLLPLLSEQQLDRQTSALVMQVQMTVAKSSQAVASLLALHKRDPGNESLTVFVAGVLLRNGRAGDAVAMLRDVPDAQFDARRIPLLLNALAVEKGIAAARSEAERIASLAPNDPRRLAMLGWFFAGRQDYPTARIWLDRSLAKLRAKNVAPATASAENNEADGVINEKEGVPQRIEELGLLKMLALVEIRLGNKNAALSGIRAYRQIHPKDVSATAVEADILMEAQDFAAAAAIYESMYAVSPSQYAAMNLYRAKHLGGLPAATQSLEQWLEGHQDDGPVRLLLAEAYQSAGDARAVAQYELLLNTQPMNVTALNNLAWLYQAANDKRALATAKKAYERANQAAEVADTYGWILLQNGQLAEAGKILGAAAAAAPNQPDIQFHHAMALARTGAVDEARKRLSDLLARHPKFAAREEAEKALANLAGK